jgi:hypothetical protein
MFLTSFTTPKDPLFFGVAVDGYPVTTNRLENIYNEIKVKPKMIVFYLMWPNLKETDKSFDIISSLKACDNFGAIPCITWEPMSLENNKEKVVLKEDVLDGKYDRYFDEFMLQIKMFKQPVIIRLGHEMNLEKYHWGVSEKDYTNKAPDAYKKMFIYIVDYFRKNDIENVFFAFCPNAESVPNLSWNQIKNYYPGNEYIDILGIDGYNFGNCATLENVGWDSTWKSFKEIFENVYNELRELSLIKPIIIFETASTSKGGNKTLWLKEAIESAEKLGISCINWFEHNKECDWKITKDQTPVLKKYFSDKNEKKIMMKEIIK